MLTRVPQKPWTSLCISAGIGPPLGALSICVLAGIFRSSDPRPLLDIVLGDALSATLIAYPFVLAAMLLYATPLLWLGLRYRFANPVFAFITSILPGVLFAVAEPEKSIFWVPLAICFGIAFIFVVRAYRPLRAGT